jgi:Uma2 family endonuclease
MASIPNSKLVSYEEWLRMPEVSDGIEEVVNGEVRLMPPNKWNHAEIVENVRDALIPQLDRRQFRVVTTSFGLIIRKSPLTSRAPDLAVFDRSTIVERDGYIHSAPALLVEVISPANRRRERDEKLADYASLGVPEFWVVWPERRAVEVFLLEGGEMRCSQLVSEGAIKPVRLPNVEVAVAELWAE